MKITKFEMVGTIMLGLIMAAIVLDSWLAIGLFVYCLFNGG